MATELSLSISDWIGRLKAGEAEAATRLWDRYADRLVNLARRRLRDAPKRMADEEDVAQSVFHCLCRGAAAGRFADLKSRDDLWWLLLAITRQKVIDHCRREGALKRGAGRVQPESALSIHSDYGPRFSLDMLIGQEPTPDFLVMLDEEHQRLLGMLRDDRLQQVAVSRIEGYSVDEIADRLDVSVRSVERKLRLIKNKWSRDLFREQ